MSQDTEERRDGNRGEEGTRRSATDAAAVRVGDRVVHTTDLGKEYEYRVAAVDDTWLTFETGQQVNRDRFDREDFAVVETAPAADPGEVADADAAAASPGEASVDPSDDATAPATDGGDLRTPNAD